MSAAGAPGVGAARVAGATGGGGLELGATARGHLGYHFGKPGDP